MGLSDTLSLNDGQQIPVMGFGTAELEGEEAEKSVADAIELSYRLIDTSPNYGNEVEVGNGIQTALDGKVKREDLFISTKVESENMSTEGVKKSVDESLDRLKLDYIDLLLIHSPADDDAINVDTWNGMKAVSDSGKVKSIGVSNFTQADLEPVLSKGNTKPSINQVELAPANVDWDTKTFCEDESIIIMAYSPLKKGTLDSEIITNLADKYNKTPQQITLRWAMDIHTIPIPRSGNRDHIIANAAVFDFKLIEDEIKQINELT